MEVGGWVIQPALPAGNGRKTDVRRQQRWADWCESLAVMGDYLKRSWRPAFWRSMGLWGLWQWNGCREPGWLGLVPWGLWLWQGLGVGWPHWRRQMLWKCGQEVLWQGQRLLLLWYLGMALSHHDAANPISASLGLSCVVCGGEKPRVEVERPADTGRADTVRAATAAGRLVGGAATAYQPLAEVLAGGGLGQLAELTQC